MTVAPGAHRRRSGERRRLAPTPYVTFVNHATTGCAKQRRHDRLERRRARRRAAGTRSPSPVRSRRARASSTRIAFPNRQPFAQAAFVLALRDAGVAASHGRHRCADAVRRRVVRPANLVAQHVSPPLSEDVYITLKVSDNLHAALMPYMWAVYLAPREERLSGRGFELEAQMLASAPVSTLMRPRNKTVKAAAAISRRTSWCTTSLGRECSVGFRICCAVCRSWASTGRS